MKLTGPFLTRLLTYCGAIPFAVLAIPGLPGMDDVQRLSAFLAYGAVIASFMAGSVWGLVQREGYPPAGTLMASNVAALAAWATLLILPGRVALLVQAAVFAGLLLIDRERASRAEEPHWYWTMRVRITVIVCVCYGAAMLGA